MSPGPWTGFAGIVLVAATLALSGCGASGTSDAEREPNAGRQAPVRHTVVGHRLGPARVEPGTQRLPARPCVAFSKQGTTEVHLFTDAPLCVRVAPGERLLFVNDTGLGPRHAGASPIKVLAGNYELGIEPQGSGLIRAPVRTYLGRGSHRVRVAGAPGATVLVLPPVCAMHRRATPDEEPCFR